MSFSDVAAAVRARTGRRETNSVQRPTLGLYLDQSSSQINPRGLVSCLNVRIKDGHITSENMGWQRLFAAGLRPLTSNNSRPTQVLLIERFMARDGTEALVFGSQKDIYRWNGTQPDYITARYQTGTVSVTIGTKTVTGVGTLWDTIPAGEPRRGARAGDFIHFGAIDQISQAATWQEIASVANDTSLDLVLNDPVGHAGVPYTIRRCFDGDEADIWDTEIFPDAQPDDVDLMFGTNGREHWKWDQALDQVELIHLSSQTTLSKYVMRFNNLMLWLHITIGAVLPQSISVSTEDTPEELTLGNAIQLAVSNGTSPIVAGLQLGEYVVIYFEDGINVLEYVGAPIQWIIRIVESEIGLVGRRAVVDRGDFHELQTLQGAFRFNGQDLEPLAPHVFQTVMRILYDDSRNYKAIGQLDESEGEVQWVLPLATDPLSGNLWAPPQTAWTESYDEYVGRFPVPITQRDMTDCTAMGTWKRHEGTAPLLFSDFDAAVGFDDVEELWASRYFGEAAPIVLFGDGAGNVFEINHANLQDGSAMVMSARHPRFPVIDGRLDGHINRVEPYLADTPSYAVKVRVWGGDTMEGDVSLREEMDFTPGDGERFVSPRVAARFAEIEIYSDEANKTFMHAGYTVDADPMGDR